MLTAMVTTAWYFLLLPNCDVIGKFIDNGITEEYISKIRKLEISFAPRCHWTSGNLPVHIVHVHDKQVLKTTASKMWNLR